MEKKSNKNDKQRTKDQLGARGEFDATGIAKFSVSDSETVVPIVVDNCAEEHIM